MAVSQPCVDGQQCGRHVGQNQCPPSYSDTEVKNGDDIPLANRGETPVDQDITFYAGLTCGVTECGNVTPCTLTAPILFQLAYR